MMAGPQSERSKRMTSREMTIKRTQGNDDELFSYLKL